MKRYFFITGIILILMHILTFYLFREFEYDIDNYISIFFLVAYIFYHKYSSKVNNKILKAINVILIFYSLFIYLFSLGIVGYMIINFPKEKFFEEKLLLPISDKIHEKNYYLMIEKFDGFYKKYKNKIKIDENKIYQYKTDTTAEILLKESSIDRDNLIDFIINNKSSVPEKEMNPGGKIPRLLILLNIVKLELIEVSKNLQNNEFDLAEQKYNKLWKVALSLNTENQIMIQYLVNIACINILINFYFNSDLKIENTHTEISKITNYIYNSIDNRAKIFLAYEYQNSKNFLQSIDAKTFDELNEMIGNNMKLKYFNKGWPFYDYYKTLRIFHDNFYKSELLFHKPYYKLGEDLKEYSSFIKAATEFSYFKNPVGKTILIMGIGNISGSVLGKEICKSKLNLFIHILNSSNKKVDENIPVDNLTGKPYTVIKEKTVTIIKSEFKVKNCQGDIIYKIKKVKE